MYLSKVMISGAACRNPYEIHRVLWNLFPEDAEAKRDFLFRIERIGQQSIGVLLQSLRQPSVTASREARIVGSKPYPLQLLVGQRLRFLLLANPVKTISDESGRMNTEDEVKKCRVPLIGDEDQRAWLLRKLNSFAEVVSVSAEKRSPLNFRKSSERLIGKIQPVCYQGTLKVVNPDGFRQLVFTGIGPAKAFGCGLMSVAPTA
jgi:CRISPR system Cascade subunit CasE